MKALAWMLLSVFVFGCSPALVRAADPTAALIGKCEAEARAAHYVDGASVEEAMRVYDACIARGPDVPR